MASCQVTIPLVGNYTLTGDASPATASFVASTDATGFTVLAAGPPPCDAFNDVDMHEPVLRERASGSRTAR